MSLVSSFKLCAVAFETTPVTVTLCPTWSANDRLLLRTSQVLPSSALRLNSFALSPCERHPVIVRVSDFPFPGESLAITTRDEAHVTTRHKSKLLMLIPPQFLNSNCDSMNDC